MKLSFKIICLFFGLLLSCSPNMKMLSQNDINFSEKDIKKIINVVETNSDIKRNPKLNYHLRYDDILNDSTVVISLVRNINLPVLQDGVTNFLKYKDEYLFVYNKRDSLSDSTLEYLKENDLVSKNKISPFFITDTRYWNLYIIKGEKTLIIKKMELLLSKEYSRKDSDEMVGF